MSPQPSSEISALVKRFAAEAGFDLAGIAAVGESDYPELNYFPQWIERGHAGDMEYLKKRDQHGRLKRASLRNAVPWARSVIVCATNYNAPHPYSTEFEDDQSGWISRYAWGAQDYHDALLRRLQEVEAKLRQAAGEINELRTW